MLTAPHSCYVKRGGLASGTVVQQHRREHWVSTIVLGLSALLAEESNQSASFCVWEKSNAEENLASRLDPNFLVETQFPDCPFHRGLHSFIYKHPNEPLLHVDIHGKTDSYGGGKIELGVMPLLVHRSESEK